MSVEDGNYISMSTQTLLTGGAGFIGYHMSKHLLQKNSHNKVIAIDNLNDYYTPTLKKKRLEQLGSQKNFIFYEGDISDQKLLKQIFKKHDIDQVINLAAQAGVRYAKKHPRSYIDSNVRGFFNLVESMVGANVNKLMYASSSSVYGANTKIPFSEQDLCQYPMSLYAATKLANEHMASSYFYTHGVRSIGLRFFNVYGPWGRPDTAYYKWTAGLLKADAIELRNNGEMWRDMTYVDDVVEAMDNLLKKGFDNAKPQIYNIGNKKPVKIMDMLDYLQQKLNIQTVQIHNVEKGREEPVKTFADTKKLERAINFSPNTPYQQGLDKFIEWYKNYQYA